MTSMFVRVPYKTEAPQGPSLLHIYRRNGRALATVTRYIWHKDGTGQHGYAELETSTPDPADDVMAYYGRIGAEVALESDDLWNPQWGRLG